MLNLILAPIFYLLSILFHPFYLGVHDLKQKEQHLEITSRLFYDDLENALRKNSGKKIDLLKNQNDSTVLSELNNYYHSHFEIKTENNAISYKLIGYEVIEESAWVYLESENLKGSSLNLTNRLLYEEHKEQQHIVNYINLKEERKTLKKINPIGEFNFILE